MTEWTKEMELRAHELKAMAPAPRSPLAAEVRDLFTAALAEIRRLRAVISSMGTEAHEEWLASVSSMATNLIDQRISDARAHGASEERQAICGILEDWGLAPALVESIRARKPEDVL